MSSNGSGIKRISYVSSNYCTSPTWSPTGEKVAYVCRAEGNFQLFVSNADGSNAQQLTTYGSNEDPSWSPDGRYIVFASTFGRARIFNLAMIKSDGTNLKQLTFSGNGYTDPSWGPVM
jgi:TolB protein